MWTANYGKYLFKIHDNYKTYLKGEINYGIDNFKKWIVANRQCEDYFQKL